MVEIGAGLFAKRVMRRWLAGGIAAAALCSVVLTAQATAADAPRSEAEIEKIVERYLLKHPEIISRAFEIARQKARLKADEEKRRTLTSAKAQIFNDPGSPIAGNAKGDITVVEFFDYRCGYCRRVTPVMEALMRQDKNVRIVYKEYPILGPASDLAARAALASRKQDKYKDFHSALMTAKGSVNASTILTVAAQIGLDVAKLRQDMLDPEIPKTIARNRALARKLQITGTPGFIVEDSVHVGAITVASVRRMIAEARARKAGAAPTQ